MVDGLVTGILLIPNRGRSKACLYTCITQQPVSKCESVHKPSSLVMKSILMFGAQLQFPPITVDAIHNLH